MTYSFASRRHGNLRSYRIFWRCKRTQHKINRSGVGSYLTAVPGRAIWSASTGSTRAGVAISKTARTVAEKTEVGPADIEGRQIGPVVSETQFNKIQYLIKCGIDEHAKLIAGGLGRH